MAYQEYAITAIIYKNIQVSREGAIVDVRTGLNALEMLSAMYKCFCIHVLLNPMGISTYPKRHVIPYR